MMLNARGPKQNRRRLLGGVLKSVAPYGAEIWGSAVDVNTYSRGIKTVFRLLAGAKVAIINR